MFVANSYAIDVPLSSYKLDIGLRLNILYNIMTILPLVIIDFKADLVARLAMYCHSVYTNHLLCFQSLINF